jgi:tetratricopeptide (TPR) repeat protein
MVRAYTYILVLLLTFGISSVQAQHLEIDSLESLLPFSKDTSRINLMNRLAYLYRRLDTAKALALTEETIRLSHERHYLKGQYDAFRNRYTIYSSSGELAKALLAVQKTVDIANEMHDDTRLAESKTSVGYVYLFLNAMPEALYALSEARDLYLKLGNERRVAGVLNGFGNVYSLSGNYEKAKEHFEQAIAIYRDLRDVDGMPIIYINMGEMAMKVNRLTEALAYFFKALQIKESVHDEETVAYILQQLGHTYLAMGDFQKAQAYLERALYYEEKYQSKRNRAGCLNGLGQVMLKLDRPQLAAGYFQRAAEILKPAQAYAGLTRSFDGLITAYEKLGLYNQAVVAQKQYQIYRDSLLSFEQHEKFSELEVRFQLKAHQEEIARLQDEQSFRKFTIMLIIVLCISGSFLLLLAVLSVRLRYQNHREAAEMERIQYETAVRAKQHTEKQLRSEIAFKARELTSFTLNIIQKNEVLEELRNQLEEIRKTLSEENRSRISKIVRNIQMSQRIDKDWDNFKMYFEQVHQGFFDNLKVTYPGLNQNDLRLCALLRLNLQTKKIATIMDISPESVKVARYRLRKKLGLASEENLSDFLMAGV